MLALSEIKGEIAKQKPSLRRRYGVRSLGIFGSYVRDEQRPDSDIDLLVEFYSPISLLRFLELERILGTLLEGKVDLVMKSALKPRIGSHILKEVIPL